MSKRNDNIDDLEGLFDDEDDMNEDIDTTPISWNEACQAALPTYEKPVDYSKCKRNEKGEIVVNKYLDFGDCFTWEQQDDYPGSKEFVDTREYFRAQTTPPKEDFDKFYATNMMYFKNVGVHEMYDYIKANNFFIDHTEKHPFAYHMGRASWKTALYLFIAGGVLLFALEMFVMGIG